MTRPSQPGDVYIDGTPIPEGMQVFVSQKSGETQLLAYHESPTRAVGETYKTKDLEQIRFLELREDGVYTEWVDLGSAVQICRTCGQGPSRLGHRCGWCGDVVEKLDINDLVSTKIDEICKSLRHQASTAMTKRCNETDKSRLAYWEGFVRGIAVSLTILGDSSVESLLHQLEISGLDDIGGGTE